MGGQQFGTNTILLDMRAYKAIVHFDREPELIEVESGLMWPELIGHLHTSQDDDAAAWAVRQNRPVSTMSLSVVRSPPTSTDEA